MQEIKLVITNIFIDDGEFLIASDNEHATAEGKNKNLNILTESGYLLEYELPLEEITFIQIR